MDARRTNVILIYQGTDITTDLKDYLTQFSYDDNEGTTDSIQIDLQDKFGKWHGPWLPGKHDEIKAIIEVLNDKGVGSVERLDCGKFFVDDVSYDGPPDKISIKAVSIPLAKGGKDEKNSRVWENVILSQIAGDVANSAGLTLIYHAPDYLYDRVEQKQETDLSFIKKRGQKEGITIKISDEHLILYEQKTYESKSALLTLKRGIDDILSYSFKFNSNGKGYKKIEVSYFDPAQKKNVKYVYEVPGIEEGPTYKHNSRAKSLVEAKRIAKNIARDKNKGEKTASFTLKGNVKMLQGYTVQIEGYAKFDGKYFISSSKHNVTGGYTTKVELREVLPY